MKCNEEIIAELLQKVIEKLWEIDKRLDLLTEKIDMATEDLLILGGAVDCQENNAPLSTKVLEK